MKAKGDMFSRWGKADMKERKTKHETGRVNKITVLVQKGRYRSDARQGNIRAVCTTITSATLRVLSSPWRLTPEQEAGHKFEHWPQQ
jgi:hypothetical protein